MAEGKVLVISSNQALSYHAKKDLTRQNFVVVLEDNDKIAIDTAKNGNFDVIVLSIKDQTLEENRLLKDLKGNKLNVSVVAVCDNYSLSSINEMQKLGIFAYLPSSFEPRNLFLVVKQAMNFKKSKQIIKIHEEKIASLDKQVAVLSKKVEDGIKSTSSLYRTLQESYIRSIKALAQTLDTRDKYTYSHSKNVTKYAVIIAEQMHLSFQNVRDIRDACELHDIGKVGIEDAILAKPGALTDDEWRKMKEHPAKGAQILGRLGLKNVAELVKQHHEHYDGNGYPEKRRGDEILLGARIISLADAYDAMTSARSYKEQYLSKQDAVEEIKRSSGRQFDPRIVEVFLKVIDKM